MKRVSLLMVFFYMASAFVPKDDTYRKTPNNSFAAGEYFEYKVHYGLFNAAEAIVSVNPQTTQVNGRACYKVNVQAKTLGPFDWIAKIKDNWQSWIDTSAIVPQKFYRNIQEDSYRKEETVVFDHLKNSALVNDENGVKSYSTLNNAQDAISGYYFLRTIDYSKYSPGDIVQIPTFFDKESYATKIRYRGREVIRTKLGRIKAIKLNPVLPENKLFKDDNSIRIWVSDDANRVPIRIEVDLWVGSMIMEMRKYNGVKQEFSWL
jgi:hypothetical protein